MKKLIVFASVFLLSIFVVEEVKAQCPFGGKVNCEGECGRFTDDNSDGFCDFGALEKAKEVEPEPVQEPQNQVQEQQEKKEPATTAAQSKKESKTKEIVKTEPIVEQEKQQTEVQTSETLTLQSETQTEELVEKKKNTPKPYNVLLITGICLAAYLLTFILVKLGKIKKITHRKIWNLALLITCLVSCLLGFVLALQINYRFGMNCFRDFLKLHVEFGIAMTVVAFFHIIWHLKYYKNLFKKS